MTELLAVERHVRESAVGLEFGSRTMLTVDEWADLGRRIGRAGNATLWCLGDWLNAGERSYGSTYTEATAITGLAYGTLANAAYVCSRIGFSLRRENLSFGHHQVVAPLDPDEQEAWLAKAVRDGLTREQLHAQIRAVRELPGTPAALARLTLAVPAERGERWKSAAERAGLEFVDWAADALDEAAA